MSKSIHSYKRYTYNDTTMQLVAASRDIAHIPPIKMLKSSGNEAKMNQVPIYSQIYIINLKIGINDS